MRIQTTVVAGICLLLVAPAWAQRPEDTALEQWLDYYAQRLPHQPADCTDDKNEPLAKGADAIEKWAAQLARYQGVRTEEDTLRRIGRLVAAQQRVDELLDRTLELRTRFVEHEASPQRRSWLLNYLKTTAGLIDLAGRMRYQLSQAVGFAAFRVAGDEGLRGRLIDLLAENDSGVGAAIMAQALIDPPPDVRGASPASAETKRRILRLIAQTHELSQIPRLAELVRDPLVEADLVVLAAETLRQVGLPQDPRPGQDEELPKPDITAGELYDILNSLPAGQLSSEMGQLRSELLAWLDIRRKQGLEGDTYRLGSIVLRPGDWLLMRNPSPYNLFTDLSPGLFTHVGVVTIETGEDGKRRMALIDLPERGRSIPATNVETYVLRTRHYLFLRHPDPEVAGAMAGAARSIIGNESKFDLNFRTDRVLPLKGQPLKGKTIHTYCAGLLLLCAQETPLPREAFFPLDEGVARGATAENLKVMRLSIGEDFISPTGALFSPVLQIAGRRAPMYEPEREVENRVFDYFAEGLESKVLTPSHTIEQTLLIKLAEAAEKNPQLAEALRRQENVNIDLVAAARTKAVVDTLDDIAYGASDDYLDAWQALTSGPPERLNPRQFSPEQIAQMRKLRETHAELLGKFEAGEITPRQLRIALVDHYVVRGQREIDRKFFRGG